MKIEQNRKDLLKQLAEIVKEDKDAKVKKVVDPLKPKKVVPIRTTEQKEATKKKRIETANAKKLEKMKDNSGKSLQQRWNEIVHRLSI